MHILVIKKIYPNYRSDKIIITVSYFDIQYGRSSQVSHACTIVMTGKTISIQSDRKSWSGKIIHSGIDIMVVSLGPDIYYFKMAPETSSLRDTSIIAAN